MDKNRAFEIARKMYPGGEPIVTINRAAKAIMQAVDEASPLNTKLDTLKAAAKRGLLRGIPEHTSAWREVLDILNT